MRAEIKERIEQIEQGIVPKGYKETKVGIIPEDWEVILLGEIADFSKGKGISKDDITDEGIECIRYGELYTKYNEYIKTIFSKTKIAKENLVFSEINDILIPSSGETAIDLATASCVLKNGVAIGGDVTIIKINQNGIFLSYYLNEVSKNEIAKLAQGISVIHLYGSHLKNLKIALPPLQEQEKIASILTQWDSLIEEQEKLIEEKRENFKIITNELINKKRRFPEFKENWKTLKLQEFVTPVVREVKKPNEPYEALGIRSHCKGTFHKFIENPEEVGMDSLYEVKADDLIVNITFAWEHAIAIANSEDEGRLVSHRFPTYEIKKEKIDLQFLRALIRQPRLKYMLGLISPGGAGRNRVLNKKDFLKLEFNLPPLKEQQKIGQFLSKLNEEILLQEEKLTLLREEKKILMQLLLTGIIRV